MCAGRADLHYGGAEERKCDVVESCIPDFDALGLADVVQGRVRSLDEYGLSTRERGGPG